MNTFSYHWFKCSQSVLVHFRKIWQVFRNTFGTCNKCSNKVFWKCSMRYTFGTFDKCSNEVFWKCCVGYTFGTFHGYNFGTFSKCSESVFHGTFSEHSKKCSRNILGTSYATKLGVSFKHSQNVPVDHFWNIPLEHSYNIPGTVSADFVITKTRNVVLPYTLYLQNVGSTNFMQYKLSIQWKFSRTSYKPSIDADFNDVIKKI